jgi:transposase
MRFLPVKQQKQQDMQCLYKIRAQSIKNRTALVNQIRGLLAEYGVTFSQEIQNVKKKSSMKSKGCKRKIIVN